MCTEHSAHGRWVIRAESPPSFSICVFLHLLAHHDQAPARPGISSLVHSASLEVGGSGMLISQVGRPSTVTIPRVSVSRRQSQGLSPSHYLSQPGGSVNVVCGLQRDGALTRMGKALWPHQGQGAIGLLRTCKMWPELQACPGALGPKRQQGPCPEALKNKDLGLDLEGNGRL